MTEEANPEENVEYEFEDEEEQNTLRNKYETGEVKLIQKEIQLVTRKIEREKIKLRITDERLESKKNQFNKLQGKPVQKNEEEKERDHKQKLAQNRNHKLETVQKPKKVNKAEEFRLTQKKQFSLIEKQKAELDGLTKAINETNLKVAELKLEISNLRKRKIANEFELNKLIAKNDEIKNKNLQLKEINDKGFEKIEKEDMQILHQKKEEGIEQDKDFQLERDGLELQYHKIIEANIQKERERKKEQAKKRQMLGIMAKQVMKKRTKSKNKEVDDSIEEQIKKLKSEEIADRIPILDLIIEKWKDVNKFKKNMLIKYNQNSLVLKKSFEIIKKFLGVEDYEELPIIYKKMQEQMESVRVYICELENEKHEKEEKKKMILEQIKILSDAQVQNTKTKINFDENKKQNIEKLKKHIEYMKHEIQEKREFFCQLQPMTDKFLNKISETYVGDYIPKKVRLLKKNKYNESNIRSIFDNIANYYKLINELEKTYDKSGVDNSNRELENLGQNMKNKLENFKFDEYLNSDFLRQEYKNSGNEYTKTIKKLSENIVNFSTSGNMSSTSKMSKILIQ